MKVIIYDNGENWKVKFTHGVQTFTLDYEADDRKSALWMAEQLIAAFEDNNKQLYESFLKFVVWYSGMDIEEIRKQFATYVKNKTK